jgi:UDP-N-acetylglucosamine/UDP-N-acetylgalactosamine 4-epimerase
MKILVTGGAGFIGANLVGYLIRNKIAEVRVLDNLSTGFYHNIQEFEGHPGFEFVEGDIRDLNTCVSACEGMDMISHQAALGSVPRSINDPLTTNDVNITGHLNILIAAREHSVKRVVYAASSSTYGDSESLPKKEDIIGKPLSPYAVTKYVNELYADVFARTYGLESIGLRYFNVFGPKQNPAGPYAAVIPLFMEAIMQGKSPEIKGDGEQTRDFTFVGNAVQANIKALLTENPAAVNQVYNIAFGTRTSLNQLLEMINKVAGKSIKAFYGPERAGDIKHSLADITKARTLLGYQPEVSLEVGLGATYKWFLENLHVLSNRG